MKKKTSYSNILIRWFSFIFILIFVAIIYFVSRESYNLLLNQTIVGKINEIALINQKITSILSCSDAVNNMFYYEKGAYGYFGNGYAYSSDHMELSYELRMDKARIKAQMDNLVTGFDLALIGNDGLKATSFMNYDDVDFSVIIENEELKKSIDDKKEAGEVLISGLYKKDRSKSYYIKYKNVFTVTDKAYLGTQLVMIQDSYFEKSYSKLKYDIGNIFLIDENGKLFNTGKYTDEEELLIRDFVSGSKEDYIISDGYLILKNYSTETGWTVAESITLSNITDKISMLVTYIAVFSVAAISAGIYVVVLLSKKITKPIRNFDKMMRRFRIGNGTEISYSEGSNIIEIDNLYKSFNEMYERNTELVDKLVENENEKRITELNYMRAQINPHFIYNTLFSIKCTIDLGRKEEAVKMIDILNEMLRRMLQFRQETTTVREELMYIHSYVKMLQFGYEKKLSLKVEMSEELQSLEMLRFVLQPIVENAVFHGIQPKNEDGEIIISGMRIQDDVEIMIYDNGVGFSQERLQEVMSEEYISKMGDQHVGIGNVHNRIRHFYGDKYGLKIESECGKGTFVYILMPAIKTKGSGI